VSLEPQHLAKRYVVRGVESSGAPGDIGHCVACAQENGQPLSAFGPVETIGVNGPQAVVLTPAIVRVEMRRKESTYELLISQHQASSDSNTRPHLESILLFRGFHGRMELDLSGMDKAQAGGVVPRF
jgi:hypothetical protein